LDIKLAQKMPRRAGDRHDFAEKSDEGSAGL